MVTTWLSRSKSRWSELYRSNGCGMHRFIQKPKSTPRQPGLLDYMVTYVVDLFGAVASSLSDQESISSVDTDSSDAMRLELGNTSVCI